MHHSEVKDTDTMMYSGEPCHSFTILMSDVLAISVIQGAEVSERLWVTEGNHLSADRFLMAVAVLEI